MNYGKLADTIDENLKEGVGLILNTEVEPERRQLNLEVFLRETGEEVYEAIYAMNAYDMEIEYTTGPGINNDYYGMAKNLSDSISLGGKKEVEAQLELWLQDQIHKAQYDAFETAGQSGKYRIVTRTAHSGCCDWCAEVVGTFIEPTSEVFRQHKYCRCEIKTEGWRSRNGTLMSARDTGKLGWKELKR